VIVLETPRLVLRRTTHADLDALAEAYCDRDNMRYFPQSYTRDDVAAVIERKLMRYQRDGVSKWAVIVKATGEVAGDCGLMMQEVDGTQEMEVGYVFARRFQGQGYATEAARASMQYAFEKLDRARLISLIRAENTPSRRVAERNGLKVEKEAIFHELPHLVYAVHRDSWSAR
jgi:RimJ/RimL family protein N-acetyltransferase